MLLELLRDKKVQISLVLFAIYMILFGVILSGNLDRVLGSEILPLIFVVGVTVFLGLLALAVVISNFKFVKELFESRAMVGIWTVLLILDAFFTWKGIEILSSGELPFFETFLGVTFLVVVNIMVLMAPLAKSIVYDAFEDNLIFAIIFPVDFSKFDKIHAKVSQTGTDKDVYYYEGKGRYRVEKETEFSFFEMIYLIWRLIVIVIRFWIFVYETLFYFLFGTLIVVPYIVYNCYEAFDPFPDL